MVNFNPVDWGYIVRWQSDLINTIESVLPVCDKPYHMNNGFQQIWAEIKKMWNHTLLYDIDNNILFYHQRFKSRINYPSNKLCFIRGVMKISARVIYLDNARLLFRV